MAVWLGWLVGGRGQYCGAGDWGDRFWGAEQSLGSRCTGSGSLSGNPNEGAGGGCVHHRAML